MTDQTESDNAALLRDLDSAAAGIQRLDRLDAEHIAKAIRALEAKVRELEEWKVAVVESMAVSASMTPGRELMEMQAENREQREALENACNLAAHTHNTLANLLARIHRDGGHYMTQHGAEKAAEDADQIVAEVFADRDRIAAELRGTQTRLSEMAGDVERWKYIAEENRSEIARLTSELEKAQRDVESYRHAAIVAEQGISVLEDTNARLTSELAAAREDADRVNFASLALIRVELGDVIDGNWRVSQLSGPLNDMRRTLIGEGETWREAVDAARRAGEGDAK